MSALIAHSSPFTLLHSLQEVLANLVHRPARTTNSLESLCALPDHLLLDIGVDPRTVECHSVFLIGHADTVSGCSLTPATRNAAKS